MLNKHKKSGDVAGEAEFHAIFISIKLFSLQQRLSRILYQCVQYKRTTDEDNERIDDVSIPIFSLCCFHSSFRGTGMFVYPLEILQNILALYASTIC